MGFASRSINLPNLMPLKYRSDIDGLRAIAVLAVLFYHTGVPGFSGGFVGVDVFFVISGYLITAIILDDIASGTFSITRFYERRIRRIFPALFPVIIFTVLAGAYLFDVNAYSDLGKSIPAVALFSSNIFYWLESGYFDAPSLHKPLLHTWSLAVEEQFYILFPLFLFIAFRFLKGRYIPWILVGIVISFGVSAWGVHYKPVHTFYLMPTRAWELLAGSILSIGILRKPVSAWKKNLLSLIGLGLLIFSVLFYNEKTIFPGYNAIAPVLGTGLIIHSGGSDSSGFVNKAISWRPLVLIGLISYSLYLWHWPLVAFSRYLVFRPLTGYEGIGIILSSFMIAYLSWKYIESPFRVKGKLFHTQRGVFAAALIFIMAFSVIGHIIVRQGGMSWRNPVANNVMEAGRWDWYPEGSYGNLELPADFDQPGKCGSESAEPCFLLWGDSHAMNLIPCLDGLAKRYGLSGYITTHSSCPPALGAVRKDSQYDSSVFNQNVLSFVDRTPKIKAVFLAASWSSYLNESSENYYRPEEINSGLVATVNALKKRGLEVFLVADTPHLGNYHTPRVFYLARRFPGRYDPNEIAEAQSRLDYDLTNAATNQLFIQLHDENRVRVVHQENAFFGKNGLCMIDVGGHPLFRDDGHLSTFGSSFLDPVYDPIIRRIGTL